MTAPNLDRTISRLPDTHGRQAFMLSVEYTPPAAEIIKSTERETLAIVVRQLGGADYECVVDGADMRGKTFVNTPPRTVVYRILTDKYGAVFAEVALKPWVRQELDKYPQGSPLTIEEHTHRELKKHARATGPDAGMPQAPRNVVRENHSRELIDVPPNGDNLRFLLMFKYADPRHSSTVIRNLRLTVRVQPDGRATMSLNDTSNVESQFVPAMCTRTQVKDCLVERYGDVEADKILKGWPKVVVPSRPEGSHRTLQQHNFLHLMHSAMARHERQVGMAPDELQSMVDKFLLDMDLHPAGIKITHMLGAPAPLAFAFRSPSPDTSHLADSVNMALSGSPKHREPEKAGIRALKAFNKWLNTPEAENAFSGRVPIKLQEQVVEDNIEKLLERMREKLGIEKPDTPTKRERTRYRLVEKKPHTYTNQDIYLDGQLIGVITTLSEGFVWYHKAAQNTGVERNMSEAVKVLCEITDDLDAKQ